MILFSTAAKLFVWRSKAKIANITVIPLLRLGVQRVESVSHYKYLRIVLDIDISDDKDMRNQYYAINKVRAFSRCSNSVKNIFFVPSVRPCMHHNYGVISRRHIPTDCVCMPCNFGCRALCNLPWRASVSSRQVQCNTPIFEALLKKMCACFLNYAKSPTIRGYALWCS